MKAVPIEIDQVLTLMESEPDAKVELYLDLETGRAHALSTKVLRAVDEDDWRVVNHLAPTLRAEVGLASDVVFNAPERYAPIPYVAPAEILRLMQSFSAAQVDETVRATLEHALTGRGAFRRFRMELAHLPEVAEAWRRHRHDAIVGKLTDWLGEVGYEPVAREV